MLDPSDRPTTIDRSAESTSVTMRSKSAIQKQANASASTSRGANASEPPASVRTVAASCSVPSEHQPDIGDSTSAAGVLLSVDYDELLEAIEQYEDRVRTHTVPAGSGRQVATIGAARSLSAAFCELANRVQPSHEALLWDGGPPPVLRTADVVIGPAGRVDRSDPEAVHRAELLEVLVDVLHFPIDRHNEQSKSVERVDQRFYAQDVLDEAMLGSIDCVRRLVQPRALRRKARDLVAKYNLNETDRDILRLLQASPSVRLLTHVIAQRLKRIPSSIGRNLSRLRTLKLIDNKRRKGYLPTKLGQSVSLA